MNKGGFQALKRLAETGKRALSRNLLLSNTLLCGVMSGLGDVVLQSSRVEQRPFDKTRTMHLTLTGLSLGPCFHFWYQALDRMLPGKALSVVAKKVLLDQIIFSPVCLSVFFVTLGFLDWSSWKDIGHEIYHKGIIIYKAEWFVWPPAQVLNFYFVPLRFRVLFINMIAFCFSILQSHVRYSDLADRLRP